MSPPRRWSPPPPPAPTEEERAAFRAFVRSHHPDVGGDPETFRRGVARFRAAGVATPVDAVNRPAAGWRGPELAEDDPRLDAPITAVAGDPLHRLGRAGARLWRRAPLRHTEPRVR